MHLISGDNETTHRALVVGLSGSGKSTLVAELSKSFDLIWIDLENAKDVLTKLPQAQLDRINYIQLPDSASFPIAAQTLMTLFKNNKGAICQKHGKIECAICKKDSAPVELLDFTNLPPSTIVVVDTATQLSASILAYTCKDKPVEYKPERDDWGGLRKYSEFFASQWQAFPGNLIVTAHVVEAEMENGTTKLVPAFGSKDMSSKIAKAFSDVIYMETKNRKHIATSSSLASNSVLTKSRSEFVIESLPTPSLIPLFKNEHTGAVKIAPATPAQVAVGNLKNLVGQGAQK